MRAHGESSYHRYILERNERALDNHNNGRDEGQTKDLYEEGQNNIRGNLHDMRAHDELTYPCAMVGGKI